VADENQAPRLPQAGHWDIPARSPLPGETQHPSGRELSVTDGFSLESFDFCP